MTIATILPLAKTQFLDGNGTPLASGSVYMYIPETSTLKTTWQDAAEQIQNTNPIILDASGEAIIYGSGEYRQVVYAANGDLIWDALTQDITSTLQAMGIVYCGTSTGSANAQILSPNPAITVLQPGQLLAFTAGFTNTNTMTIQTSAIPPVQLYYGGSVAQQNSVQAGGYTLVDWDGVHYQLANPVTPSYPANTFVANATNSTNFPTGIVLANGQLAGRGASGNITAITPDGVTVNIFGTTLSAAITYATKSDMQVATSTDTIVNPAQVQNHPGVAKAWCAFTGSTGSILESYNIDSIVRNGAGDYTANFLTDFSTANYAPIIQAGGGSASGTAVAGIKEGTTPTVGGFEFTVFENTATPTLVDMGIVTFAVFGTQ